jgi:hypothetical protein
LNTSICISVNSGHDWSNCVEVPFEEPIKRVNYNFSCFAIVSPSLQLYQTAFVNISVPSPSPDYKCIVSFDSPQLTSLVVPVIDNFCKFNASHVGSVSIDVIRFNVVGCSVSSVVFEETKCSVASVNIMLGDSVLLMCSANIPFDYCHLDNMDIPAQIISNGLFSCTVFNVTSGPKLIRLVSTAGHVSSWLEITVNAHDRVYSVDPDIAYIGFETKIVFTGSFSYGKQYSCIFAFQRFAVDFVSSSELVCLIGILHSLPEVVAVCLSTENSGSGCFHSPFNVTLLYLPTVIHVAPSIVSVNHCRPFVIKMSSPLSSPKFVVNVGQLAVAEASINRSRDTIHFTYCFRFIGKNQISLLVDGNLHLKAFQEIVVIAAPYVTIVQPTHIQGRSETFITVKGWNLHHINSSICKFCDKVAASTFSSSNLVICPAPFMPVGTNCSISISSDGSYFPANKL